MTNSEATQDACRIIAEIMRLLDEEFIQQETGAPIDHALETYELNPETTFSLQVFHQAIAGFMCHIHKEGLPIRQNLTYKQALTEAISLLESGYQSRQATGYTAAYIDASNEEQNGIAFVVKQMAELIKAKQKEKYVRWVMIRMDQEDWTAKCRITETLKQILAPFLPEEILRCPPAQMADNWQNLLKAHLDTDAQLR